MQRPCTIKEKGLGAFSGDGSVPLFMNESVLVEVCCLECHEQFWVRPWMPLGDLLVHALLQHESFTSYP